MKSPKYLVLFYCSIPLLQEELHSQQSRSAAPEGAQSLLCVLWGAATSFTYVPTGGHSTGCPSMGRALQERSPRRAAAEQGLQRGTRSSSASLEPATLPLDLVSRQNPAGCQQL